MDPYLEKHWGDVHERMIVYAAEALQTSLPNDLLARIEERVFVESNMDQRRRIIPDVRVSEGYPPTPERPSGLREGEAGAAEPIIFELDDLEITESYVTIREGDAGRVITVIEFLSPTNKRPGAGQEKYIEKQREVLGSDASLVEIDLVRAGERVLALPRHEIPLRHRGDYLSCISPGWKRSRRELYALPLRRRLPLLPIPLRQHETPVNLDLQVLLDRVYTAGRYDKLDYRADLDPPLPPKDAEWAAAIVKAGGQY
jgi:Protein of unknown function (DUF4058)